MVYPDTLKTMIILRTLVLPVSAIAYYYNKRSKRIQKSYMTAVYILIIYISSILSWLVTMTGFEQSPAYLGISQLAIGIITLVPFPVSHLFRVILAIYGPYYFCLYLKPETLDFLTVFINTTHMGGIVIIILLVFFDGREKRKQNFIANSQIRSMAELQNKTIARNVHDVKAPFNFLSFFIDTVEKARNLEELHQKTAKLRESGKRLVASANQMVSDVMDLGNDHHVSLTSNSLYLLINESIWECFSVAKKPYRFDYNLKHKHCVKADYIKIKRVFHNIFTNILSATGSVEDSLLVSISSYEKGDFIWISIKNYGSSVKDIDPNELLKPYAQGKKPNSGKGLGLSIVSHFVSLHGGQMYIGTDVENNSFAVNFSLTLAEDLDQSVSLPEFVGESPI